MAETRFHITINRQFGSMGRPIAKKAAELLKINFYDRDIVEKTAASMGMRVHEVSDLEERKLSSWGRMAFPLGIGTTATQDEIFVNQSKFIEERASLESCIFVGRCSEYILKDEPNLIRIYIYAPYEARLKNCIELLHMDEKEAIRMIGSVDKARDRYHEHYTGYIPSDPDHVDLMINSAVTGIDGTARLIESLVRERLYLKK